jgi:hypothetical protein
VYAGRCGDLWPKTTVELDSTDGVIPDGLRTTGQFLGTGPPLATTVAAIAGFVIVMYGVHVGWLVFYDRETDGPSS